MRRTLPLALALVSGSALAQPCAPGWSNHFGTGILANSPAAPSVLAQLPVGPAAMIIAGQFARAGSVTANSIARWDGSAFTPLGGGLTQNGAAGTVNALAEFTPPGGSPLIIAGGSFDHAGGAAAHNLAAWDGASWQAIPGVPTQPSWYVDSIIGLMVADPDGTGPLPRSLVVSVSHSIFDGVAVHDSGELWAWDGSAWTLLVQGNAFGSLAQFPAQPGSPIYTVGRNSVSPGHCISSWSTSFAREDASGSTTLLTGSCLVYCGDPPCTSPQYFQTISFDPDATGPAPARLLLGGQFDSVLGIPAHNLAAFDGTSWSQFAGGADGIGRLFALSDPGTGLPSLYATGHNFTVAGAPVLALARYDINGWTALPYGMTGNVSSMVPATMPGSDPAVYIGGVTNAGVAVPGWTRLTPYGWAPIGQCLNNEVHTLALFAPAGQPASLYAGGAFTTAAGQLASGLARWDGAEWHPVINLNNDVGCMAANGQYLALGGSFTLDGLPTGGIALYDGTQLLRLGTGMNTPVHALAWFGGQLYAGGTFTLAGGTPAVGIARWNGSAWSPLGSGTNNHVDALAVYDDGAGPALYVGGKFSIAGGQPASHLARWTGSAWSPIAAGGADGNIEALTVMNDGSGPALYLGGDFSHVGSLAASCIARYRAGAFTALASNVDGTVRALSALDPDSAGPLPAVLVAGGDFTHIDSIAASYGAIWNGHAWEPLNLGGSVYALAPYQPSGSPAPAMYFGGAFGAVDGVPTSFIADLTRCTCYANCDTSTAPPVLNVNDFVCFLNLFAAGSAAANCDGSTTPPVLNVGDFNCFLNAFAAGCP